MVENTVRVAHSDDAVGELDRHRVKTARGSEELPDFVAFPLVDLLGEVRVGVLLQTRVGENLLHRVETGPSEGPAREHDACRPALGGFQQTFGLLVGEGA